MPNRHNDFEELGVKVQRAQYALEQIRGTGTSDGIQVVVDAENHLLSVSVPDADAIVRAYNAAVADKQPRVDEAMRAVCEDPRVVAASTFTRANAARLEAERIRHASWEEYEDYVAKSARKPWEPMDR